MKNNFVIFYDGQCDLCDRIVHFILERDKKKLFLFAPLQGKTAKEMLLPIYPDYQKLETVILLEKNPLKVWKKAKACFRILYLLGGIYSFLGLLHFLPSIFMDWAYNIVANHRPLFFKLLFRSKCLKRKDSFQDRFLD